MLAQNRTPITHRALIDLQSQIGGAVLTPDDPGYDEARLNWNVSIDQHPALIVIAESYTDILHAVRFANSENLQIVVKATGHGAILPANDCLLVVTATMKGVHIDVSAQIATVEAGVQWSAVLASAQKVGLAPLLGSSPNVGVVGYTLGGGMGWLVRQYGLAIDSVIGFRLVTPAGELIDVNANENADLYWALRGGGGNFGIVVEMSFQLYPVTTVYAGNLYYPVSAAREVLTRYAEWTADAPEALTSGVTIMNYPPMPELPDFLRGQSYVQVRGCYTGNVEDGEALLAFWREWQAPIVDDWKAMPFSDSALISNDPVDPMPTNHTGAWMHTINEAAIDALVNNVPAINGPNPLIFAEIRHAGGAMKRSARGENCFSLRDGEFILEMVGMTPTREAKQAFVAYTNEVKALMQSAMTGGIYMNFANGEEARQQSRKGYTLEAYTRLQELKNQYDPQNRFDHSINLNAK